MNFKCLLKGHGYGKWCEAVRANEYGEVPIIIRYCNNCKSRDWVKRV